MKADTLETPKAVQPQLVAAACAEAAKPGRLRGRKCEGGLRGYFGFKTKVCGYQGLVQGTGDVGSGTGFSSGFGFGSTSSSAAPVQVPLHDSPKWPKRQGHIALRRNFSKPSTEAEHLQRKPPSRVAGVQFQIECVF